VPTLSIVANSNLTRTGSGGYTTIYPNLINAGTSASTAAAVRERQPPQLPAPSPPGRRRQSHPSATSRKPARFRRHGGLIQLNGNFTTPNLGTINLTVAVC